MDPGGGAGAAIPYRTLAVRRGYALAEESDAYVVFHEGKPETAIERFPLSDEGFGGAEALFRKLVHEGRARSVRPVLIGTVVVGIAVWVVSSSVLGAFYTHFAGRGWQGYVAAGSLSISEVSNAIWRSALVVLVLMWLVDAHTTPDRRGLKIGLASVGVAALVAWVVSTCAYGILTAPLGGISGTAANVFTISARVLHASLAVWTSALAALVLMWMVRSTATQRR